jgi:hypothetical protein
MPGNLLACTAVKLDFSYSLIHNSKAISMARANEASIPKKLMSLNRIIQV